jgi:NAD(P)-dependent dehydrogenase (short-subunit alcohol dehydrogenase family)
MKTMENKTVAITGANTGIGLQTAKVLAKQGAKIIALCRNPGKGYAALKAIEEYSGRDDVELIQLDLSDLSSVRKAASEIESKVKKLDVLINNAGLIMPKRQLSKDGYEMTFAVNHLGHFLLTDLLLPLVKKAEQGRIINVSSGAHWGAKIDFDDLMAEKKYTAFKAYGQSKLANILFTRELAKRLEAEGISVNALHPGFVRSDFAKDREKKSNTSLILKMLSPLAIPVEKGALTSIYLASDPEAGKISGEYFAKEAVAKSSGPSKDMAAASKLWDLSEELVGNK